MSYSSQNQNVNNDIQNDSSIQSNQSNQNIPQLEQNIAIQQPQTNQSIQESDHYIQEVSQESELNIQEVSQQQQIQNENQQEIQVTNDDDEWAEMSENSNEEYKQSDSSGDPSESENLNSNQNKLDPSQITTGKKVFNCPHYQRNCHKQCPECTNFFPCRVCHDDAEYYNAKDIKKAHNLDRFKVTTVKCLFCDLIQDISQRCKGCLEEFAGYYCDVCKFLDGKYLQKGVYHCDKCKLCRVGGKENYFHCDPCGFCIPIIQKETHQCQGQQFNLSRDCGVCLEDLFSSRDPASQLRCGHYMHMKCLNQYQKTSISCPLCKKKQMYDPQVAEIQMPQEYQDQKMNIICNDCTKKSSVKFHFYGKCPDCRSYNTTRT